MKKPNCRRTDDEKRVHDRAVRLRNMTDAQKVWTTGGEVMDWWLDERY